MTAGLAWYDSDRASFLSKALDEVVGTLANAATAQGLHIEPQQNEEWRASVGLLQKQLAARVEMIREALASPDLSAYHDVILEYDFRRRGLRLDCVLLGDGIIAVVEFKRSTLTAADRDQVANYCINLVEFHEETRRACQKERCVVVPVLTLTSGTVGSARPSSGDFHDSPWDSIVRTPLECDASSLSNALRSALKLRRAATRVSRTEWLNARFSPSSSILDAAISLYGAHDVSAISQHAASVEQIEQCTNEVADWIAKSKRDRKRRIIFVSGAPGAGKTLVGLKLAFDPRFRADAVFVTGNAPLVDVLTEALTNSYLVGARSTRSISGYSMKDAQQVIRNSSFKIVKAHQFLGERGGSTGSADGSVVIFDEAQRTYAKGREVLRKKLEEDEAELILASLENSYGDEGAVVVALVGHNQAINAGELGISAWFRAATKRKWEFVVGDETLGLSEISESTWEKSPLRARLTHGHLAHSLRYYRNKGVEKWVAAVLEDRVGDAKEIADGFDYGDRIWIVRDLKAARDWVRRHRVGEERAGLIASSQARRLAAEGLFVDFKPDIASWVLAPSGDIRSSNGLETVQTQFKIQGLEIDYSVVCWDLDLRRSERSWASFRLAGSRWQRDASLDVAKNSYRVLLTRARKGMVVFVPRGDVLGEDDTRPARNYDAIASFLLSCGAHELTSTR